MSSKALTEIAIRHLKPRLTRREIPDPSARGLYVIVQPSGRKSFAVRYRFSGRPRKLTLARGISLAAARKVAADAMFEVEQGRDPSVTKKTARESAAAAAANTVRAVCEEYLNREGKRLRSVKHREAILKRLVYPRLGNRPISAVKRKEIIRLLDAIEDENGASMADMTLAVLRKIVNWHAVRDENFISPIVRGMARTKPRDRARSRTLTDDELRNVWTAANKVESPFSSLVKFLMLTAARRNEAAAMTWDELDGADWVLPAGRNKVKLDLVRPLSHTAQAILAKRPRFQGSSYIFTGDGRRPMSGFSKFKKQFDAACGVSGWTLHDLRRTARSLMSRAGVNSDHAERSLGHVMPGVRATYDRHEFHTEKKVAFEALAAQIERIINPPQGVVTPLRRGHRPFSREH